MEQWLRDALAEEMGYIICPLAPKIGEKFFKGIDK